MRQLLHAVWPLMAVIAFTAALALQIPRKALFFQPAMTLSEPAFASFVEFDQAAYAKVMQQVRMSWQMRSKGGAARTESPLAVLDMAEESPPRPESMALPDSFFAGRGRSAPRIDAAQSALRPPTLAAPRETLSLAAPDDAEERRQLRTRLLELPPSLQNPD